MQDELITKLKNPVYVIWLIARSMLGLFCGVVGYFSIESSGYVNYFLWTLLGLQFWMDGDFIKKYFKINRFILIAPVLVAILATT